MSDRGASVTRNTVLNLLGSALPLAIGVIALPVIVRGLGTDRLGLLGLGWVVLGYFALLDLGTSLAATRFAADALGRGARHEVAGIIWAAAVLQGALGIAGTVLLTAATPLIVHQIGVGPALMPEAQATFRILAIAIPVVLLSASFRGGLEAARRFDLVNLVSVPGGMLNFLVPLAGVLAGWGLTAILWLLVAARTATLLAYVVLCARLYPGLMRFAPRWTALRQLLPFGLWVTVSSVVSPILDQLDRLLLGVLGGLSSVGYYTAPQEMALRSRVLPSALARTLFPEFSRAADTPGGTSAARHYPGAVRLLAVVLTPLAVATVFLSHDLLQAWLGADIAAHGAAALQWLAIGVVFNSVGYIPSAYLNGVNRPDLPAKFHLLELPGFLLVAWLLMPRWGAAGAGAGWALRAAADAVLLLGAAGRLGATRGAALPLINTATISWGALAIATIAFGFVASSADLGVPLRIIAATAGATTVFVTAWFGVLTREERGYVNGLRGLLSTAR